MTWLLIAARVPRSPASARWPRRWPCPGGGSALPLRRKLRSPWLWLALLCMGLALLLWLLVLQRLEVGVAYPMLSLNFVLVTMVSRYVLGKPPITGTGWAWP